MAAQQAAFAAQMTVSDWLAIIGIIAGVVSIILGVLAILLAVWFFISSKRTEGETQSALEGIRSQTETLATLSNQQMRGLTSLVKEQIRRQPAPDEPVREMFAFLQQVTLGQSSLLRGSAPSGPTHGTTIENHGIPQLGPVDRDSLRDLAVTTHLAIYYYATYSNILAQNWLPRRADYDEENQFHRFIRHFLDMSANDFQIVARTLDQWRIAEPTFIANHRLNLIYGVEGQRVKAAVRNANQKFEELEGAVPPESGQ